MIIIKEGRRTSLFNDSWCKLVLIVTMIMTSWNGNHVLPFGFFRGIWHSKYKQSCQWPNISFYPSQNLILARMAKANIWIVTDLLAGQIILHRFIIITS